MRKWKNRIVYAKMYFHRVNVPYVWCTLSVKCQKIEMNRLKERKRENEKKKINKTESNLFTAF